MPNVRPNQPRTFGKSHSHTGEEISKIMKPAMARDDLRAAFAGDENKGPKKLMKSESHSTNVKSRKTEKSKAKTPVR